MTLTNFQNLSTDEKLAVLRTSAGLMYLNDCLSEGHSLKYVSRLLDIDPKTMYRWRRYPDIAEVVAQFKSSKPVTTDSIVYQPSEAAYRIICAYEDHSSYIKGYIYDEFKTPDSLWNGSYMRNYFGSWGITGDEYYESYLIELKNKSMYLLSNYTLLVYCKVSAKGKIIPISPKI